MFRLKIDLRSSNGSLIEERDFDSDLAAQSYYREIRTRYGKDDGQRVESRSSIMEHIGGDLVQFWAMRHIMAENVKGKMLWKKRP